MGQLRPVTQTMRVTPSQDVLHIRHLSPDDAGRWVCRVSNQFGEQRLETQLTVTEQLRVHEQPPLLVCLNNLSRHDSILATVQSTTFVFSSAV
jgi:hypothetical protein